VIFRDQAAGAEDEVSDKSPDAFRTISEVAEDLDLPHHVLRFWETRFTQIKPLKRGGGRRYYRPDDVALIMGLKTLLYGQGYTIKGVQRILKEQGVRAVQAIGRGAPVGAEMQAARTETDDAGDLRPEPQQRIEPGFAPVNAPARGPVASSAVHAGPAPQRPAPPSQGADPSLVNVLKLALAEVEDAKRSLLRALQR
jgi:DNA-binding transcriptional MerR regulator